MMGGEVNPKRIRAMLTMAGVKVTDGGQQANKQAIMDGELKIVQTITDGDFISLPILY